MPRIPAPNPQLYTADTPASYHHSQDYSTAVKRSVLLVPPLEKFYSTCVPNWEEARNVKQVIYGGTTNQPTIKT
jgi:hypothetical protein